MISRGYISISCLGRFFVDRGIRIVILCCKIGFYNVYVYFKGIEKGFRIIGFLENIEKREERKVCFLGIENVVFF